MKETKVKKDQIPINFSFISNKSFDNYIAGNDNLTIDFLMKFHDNPLSAIIFLIGKKSSGKSHLCLAIKAITSKSTVFLNEANIDKVHFDEISRHELLIIDNIDKIIKQNDTE
jgi:chromosomal replication initiation ATPase DnaA